MGGFGRAYDASIVEDATLALTYLKISAPSAARFSRTTTFSGCFDASIASCIFSTPSPSVIGVCHKGQVSALDVFAAGREIDLDVMPVRCVTADVAGGRMFFATDLDVAAFDGTRVLWTSRRVSLDGIRDLSYAEGRNSGFATDVGIESVAFTIDACSGMAEGGFTGVSATKIAIAQSVSLRPESSAFCEDTIAPDGRVLQLMALSRLRLRLFCALARASVKASPQINHPQKGVFS